ncbi:hypothetical protein Bbelb_173100 [Branchiostoma belcheri]|nr:hypothetical protein Bbelb_173100 [Branchiostoma belcheri]
MGPLGGRPFPFLMNDEQVEAELTALQREREKLMKKKKVLELRHEVARLQMEADSSQPPPPPQLHWTASQGQRRESRRYSSSESRRQGETNTVVYNKKPSPDIERSNREPKTPPRTTPDVTPEFKNPPGITVQRKDSRASRSSKSSRTEPAPPADLDAPVFRNPPPFDLVGMDTLRGPPPDMAPEVFPPEGSRSGETVTSPETNSSAHSKEKEDFLKRRKEKKEGTSSRHGSVRSTTSSVRRFSDLGHQPRTGTVSSVRSHKDVRGSPVAPPRHGKKSDPTSPTSPGQTALFDFTQPSGSVRSRTGVPANHVVVPDYGRDPPRSPEVIPRGDPHPSDLFCQSEGVTHPTGFCAVEIQPSVLGTSAGGQGRLADDLRRISPQRRSKT